MAEEVSDRELQELLAGARRRGQQPSPGAGAFSQTPLSYDFKRPQHLNKDQLRIVENIHEHFARLFSAALASSMRMIVDVEVAFIDQALYSEFTHSLPTPCSAYRFTMTPPGGRAILAFASELLMAVIDRALGGKGRGFADESRGLTQIEVGIVDKLASRTARDLEVAWEPRSPLEISDLALETTPEFIQVAAPGDGVVVVALEAHSTNAAGLVHLCYPLTVLDPLLPKRSTPAFARNRQAGKQKPRLEAHALGKVKMPVVIQIARGSLSLGEVAQLRPGDIVKLDTAKSEPAVVFIGDRPKFLGRPGLRQRKRAVQILRAIDPQEEDLYR